MIKLALIAALTIGPLTESVHHQSLEQAALRYGPLTSDYMMVNKEEWIVKFRPELFGLKLKTNMMVNKDLVIPLSIVFTELAVLGLLDEITLTFGCFAPRSVRGENRPSVHAYGLGCDFDNKFYTPNFIAVWEKYGFVWGGRWPGKRYDPMHFSFGSWEY